MYTPKAVPDGSGRSSRRSSQSSQDYCSEEQVADMMREYEVEIARWEHKLSGLHGRLSSTSSQDYCSDEQVVDMMREYEVEIARISNQTRKSPTIVEMSSVKLRLQGQKDLLDWNISPINDGIDAKAFFNMHITKRINDKRLELLESCKLCK
nr:pesticidal crystal cry8Ba protein [Tanacetum cinerariifolium]